MRVLTSIAAAALVACTTHHPLPTEPEETVRDAAPAAGTRSDATTEPSDPSPVSSAPQSDRPWRNNIAFLIGGRQLDEDYWDPVEDQFMFGLEGDFRPPDLPLGLELGLSTSLGYDSNAMGSGIDVYAFVGEIYGGPRLTIDLGDDTVHAYVAGGVTFLLADFEGDAGGTSVGDSDTSFAGYVHGGILFTISSDFNLGVDLRADFGSEITLFGADGDADYFQIALVLATSY